MVILTHEYVKSTIKEILIDRYTDFKNKYWYRVPENMREHVDGLVNEAIKFSDIKNGFAEYICEECGYINKVPFICKSKFCNRCGRFYIISHWYKKNKKCDYEVGVIAVIHTFGRDLKWNSHVHALGTDGAVDKNNRLRKSVEYMPHSFFKKA